MLEIEENDLLTRLGVVERDPARIAGYSVAVTRRARWRASSSSLIAWKRANWAGSRPEIWKCMGSGPVL
jgi:hypothetical protein